MAGGTVWLAPVGLRVRMRGGMRFLPFIVYFIASASLHAHAVHASTAEAEYNVKTKRLEVSLTVFVSDLETALVRQCEREMRMDKTPAADFEEEVLTYLVKHFVVTDAAGKVAKMEWVGREMEEASAKSGDPAVVLFFEVAMPTGMQGQTLKHSVFHELFKDQMNLLLLRDGALQEELRFASNEAVQLLKHPNK